MNTHTPKEVAQEIRAETAETMSPASQEQDIGQKLDVIIGYLHAINRRDRARYYGGLVHSLISLIPMLLFVLSAWYIYQNGEELLSQIVGETVKQTTTMSTEGMDAILRNFLPPATPPPPAVIR